MPAPIILLPARQFTHEPRLFLEVNYAEAIQAAGGAPVLLPLLDGPDHAAAILPHAAGICLTGSSSDVDPARYGQARHPALGPVQPRRDRLDLYLLEHAFRAGMPVFCICYGIQILNVFLGGTLYQDLPSAGFTGITHSRPGLGEYSHHSVRLDPAASPLGQATPGETPVNSSHHQAIRDLGRDLVPFAWSPDGLIEGVALRSDAHFVAGVQWHPEASWPGHPFSAALLRRFIEHCLEFQTAP